MQEKYENKTLHNTKPLKIEMTIQIHPDPQESIKKKKVKLVLKSKQLFSSDSEDSDTDSDSELDEKDDNMDYLIMSVLGQNNNFGFNKNKWLDF